MSRLTKQLWNVHAPALVVFLLWPLDCSTTVCGGGGLAFYQGVKRGVRCWLMPAKRLRRFSASCMPKPLTSQMWTRWPNQSCISLILSRCWETTVKTVSQYQTEQEQKVLFRGLWNVIHLHLKWLLCIFAGRNEPWCSKQSSWGWFPNETLKFIFFLYSSSQTASFREHPSSFWSGKMLSNCSSTQSLQRIRKDQMYLN